MDKTFFDSTLDFNWDILPVDRSFDENKVKEYLPSLDEPDRSFIEELLNKTTYINYSHFKQAFQESFERFKENIGQQEFYLLLCTTKPCSENWLTALIWSQLRTLNIKGIINYESNITFENPTNILLIDDCIYSGHHLTGVTDNFTYSKPLVNNIIFHIMAPFACDSGKNCILGFNNYIKAKVIIYNVRDLPKLSTLIDLTKYYSNAYDILYKKFGFEILELPLVYFDHKVAGVMSTYSTIYLEGRRPGQGNYGSLLKENVTREKINKLGELYNSRAK